MLDYINIWRQYIMKRSYVIFAVSFLVLLSVGLWLISSEWSFEFSEYIHFAIIIFIVGCATFLAISRYRSEKRGEPSEDEMSKQMLQKASSISFFISIYLWLVIMYIADKSEMESDLLFGWGILGMALIFALSWIVIYLKGMKSE